MNQQREQNFKVIPFKGALTAPAIYVDAKKEKEAISEAKSKSGLSRFENWVFIPIAYDDRGKVFRNNKNQRKNEF